MQPRKTMSNINTLQSQENEILRKSVFCGKSVSICAKRRQLPENTEFSALEQTEFILRYLCYHTSGCFSSLPLCGRSVNRPGGKGQSTALTNIDNMVGERSNPSGMGFILAQGVTNVSTRNKQGRQAT